MEAAAPSLGRRGSVGDTANVEPASGPSGKVFSPAEPAFDLLTLAFSAPPDEAEACVSWFRLGVWVQLASVAALAIAAAMIAPPRPLVVGSIALVLLLRVGLHTSARVSPATAQQYGSWLLPATLVVTNPVLIHESVIIGFFQVQSTSDCRKASLLCLLGLGVICTLDSAHCGWLGCRLRRKLLTSACVFLSVAGPVTLAAHEIIGALAVRECVDAAQCAAGDERRMAALAPFTYSANVATAAIFGWCVTCWVIGAGATHLAEAVYRQRQYIGRLVEQRRKLIDERIRREEGEFESAKEFSRLLAMRTWPAMMTRSRRGSSVSSSGSPIPYHPNISSRRSSANSVASTDPDADMPAAGSPGWELAGPSFRSEHSFRSDLNSCDALSTGSWAERELADQNEKRSRGSSVGEEWSVQRESELASQREAEWVAEIQRSWDRGHTPPRGGPPPSMIPMVLARMSEGPEGAEELTRSMREEAEGGRSEAWRDRDETSPVSLRSGDYDDDDREREGGVGEEDASENEDEICGRGLPEPVRVGVRVSCAEAPAEAKKAGGAVEEAAATKEVAAESPGAAPADVNGQRHRRTDSSAASPIEGSSGSSGASPDQEEGSPPAERGGKDRTVTALWDR